MSKHHVLIVTSMAEGFRRAGRAWSKRPTTVDAGVFSAAQVEALRADAMLTVTDEQVDVAEVAADSVPDTSAADEGAGDTLDAPMPPAPADLVALAPADDPAKADAKAAKKAGKAAAKPRKNTKGKAQS